MVSGGAEMTVKVVKLTPHNINKYRKYARESLHCTNCGRQLKIGDYMVSKRSNKMRRYCLECTLKLYLIDSKFEHIYTRILSGKQPIPAKGEKAYA
jgi:hypothetical protein